MSDNQKHRAIYRVINTFYKTKKGCAKKTEFIKMKKLSYGWDPLKEEVANVGDDTVSIMLNINELKNGIYEAVVVNVSHDYETGTVDGWEIELKPFKE